MIGRLPNANICWRTCLKSNIKRLGVSEDAVARFDRHLSLKPLSYVSKHVQAGNTCHNWIENMSRSHKIYIFVGERCSRSSDQKLGSPHQANPTPFPVLFPCSLAKTFPTPHWLPTSSISSSQNSSRAMPANVIAPFSSQSRTAHRRTVRKR
jgi:hypothetical protein